MFKNYPEVALLIVRVTLGSVFFLHGAQKVFGWFGGSGLEGFVKWCSTINIPIWMAYMAAFTEFASGVSLLLGLWAEVGALGAICVMTGAIYFVHLKSGYFAQNGGYEYALNLLLFSLAIVIGGPGKLALIKLF